MHHEHQGSSKQPSAATVKSSKANHNRRSSAKACAPPRATQNPPAPQRARAASMPSSRLDLGEDWRKPRDHSTPSAHRERRERRESRPSRIEPKEPKEPKPAKEPAAAVAKSYASTVQISFPITIAGLTTTVANLSVAEEGVGDREDHGRLVLPPPGIRGPAKLVLNVEALTTPQTATLVLGKEDSPVMKPTQTLRRHQRVDSAASVSSIHSAKWSSIVEDKGTGRGHARAMSADVKPPVLGLDMEGLTISDKNAKHPLYKTEMCRTWEETGHCRYGGKCQFAHGEHELRKVQRHPKYKTEVCRTFFERGECPYGKRCCFIHNCKKSDGLERFIEHLNEQKRSNTASPSENTTPVLPATPATPAFGAPFKEGGRERAHEYDPFEAHHDDLWHVLTPPMQPVATAKVVDTFDLMGPRPRTVSVSAGTAMVAPLQPAPAAREGPRPRTVSDGLSQTDDRKRLPVFKNFS